jgi:hypothetical protein
MQIQSVSDRVSIGLSFLCILHCVLLPTLLVLMPSAVLVFVSDESVHKALLFAIVPVGVYALFFGYKIHKKMYVLAIAVSGMVVLVSTGILEHEVLGEMGEVLLTVVGSSLIVFGHIQNVRLRKQAQRQVS